MVKIERRGRTHDAEAAKQAILDAAESIFAQHGFDGARVDAIASEAGYNKSLLFQYFGDKLGLYAEVVERADRQMGDIQKDVIASLQAEENFLSRASEFREFLATMVRVIFDYMIEHPNLLHIMLW